MWPFCESEVQAGGNKPFLPFLRNSTLVLVSVHSEVLSRFSKTPLERVAKPPLIPRFYRRAGCWSTTKYKKGLEDGTERPGFNSTLVVPRNVKRFPRKFFLLQQASEGNQENFDTFRQWEWAWWGGWRCWLVPASRSVNSVAEQAAVLKLILFTNSRKEELELSRDYKNVKVVCTYVLSFYCDVHMWNDPCILYY